KHNFRFRSPFSAPWTWAADSQRRPADSHPSRLIQGGNMRQRNVLLLLCLGLLSTLKVHAQSRAKARVYEDIIHTYAGGGPDGIPALSANLPVPTAVATDCAGNIYTAAPGANR